MRIKKILTILLTVAMVVSLLPATAFAANNTATTMRLAKTQGTVTVTNATGKNVTQTGNMKLYNGYKVKTGAKSYAWISLDDTKVAKLDANSVMEVQKSGKNLTLYLSSGGMFFNVKDPLKSGETFSIKTSTMTTGIRGTSGCVRVISPRVTEIHLLTGEVLVYAEHPALGLSKTETLKAGQKATSLIDWEAMAASGVMVEILIERLENHEICGICSKEIANDPALLERIAREAPHLLPEKAAAEADERIAADEAEAEEKQEAIDKAVAEQVFPEDVDPYFEEKSGGGGGGGGSSATVTPAQIVDVATWAELLQAITDYNNAAGITQINLTASIPTDAELEEGQLEPLPEIKNMNALTLNLGTNTLLLNGTLVNDADLTITNVDGYIIGNGSGPAVQNKNILTLKDGQINGNGQTAVLNSAGTFSMNGGELVAPTQADGNMLPPALDNMTGAMAYLYGGTIWSDADEEGLVGVQNSGTLTVSGTVLNSLRNGIVNTGTASMSSGQINISGTGVENRGSFSITGGQIIAAADYAKGILMTAANATAEVKNNAVITASGYGSFGIQAGAGTLSISGGTVSAETESTEDAMGAVAVGIDNAAVSASVTAPALIRAKGESDVFLYAADGQWPAGAEIMDDTETSGYYILSLTPEEEPSGINTWTKLVTAVRDFNEITTDDAVMTITLEGNIPAETETNLVTMDPIASGNKHLIIDLNGHSLTLPQTITVNGNLEIVGGGTISASSAVSNLFNVTSTGSIELDNNASGSAPTINLGMNQTAINSTQSGVYMNAGKIQMPDLPSTGIYSDNGNVIMAGGEMILIGCGDNYANIGIQATNGATVKVENGTIREGDGIADAQNDNNYAIYAENSTVQLNGGTVSVHNAVAIYVSDVSQLTLASATVTGKVANNLLVVKNNGPETGFYTEAVSGTAYHKLLTTVPTPSELFVQKVLAFDGSQQAQIDLTGDVTIDTALLSGYQLNKLTINGQGGTKSLTIDLKGYDLNLNAAMANTAITGIKDSVGGGVITSTASSTSANMIENTATLSLQSVTMQVMDSTERVSGILNSGSLQINTGTEIDVYKGAGIRTTGGTVILNAGVINVENTGTVGIQEIGGTVNLVGGTINVKSAGAVGVETYATTSLAGTTIDARSNNAGGIGISVVDQNAALTMNSGTIWTDNRPAVAVSAGTFQMTGGSIQSRTINDGALSLSGGTTTMSGGTITVNGADGNERGVYITGETTQFIMDGTAAISVTGRSTSNGRVSYAIYDNGGIVTINGGTITATDGGNGAGNLTYALFSTGWTGLTVDTANATVKATTKANVIAPVTGSYTASVEATDGYFTLVTDVNQNSMPEGDDPEIIEDEDVPLQELPNVDQDEEEGGGMVLG